MKTRICVHIKHGINITFVWSNLTIKQGFCGILVENDLIASKQHIASNLNEN